MSDFSKYMTPPIPYVPNEDEIEALSIIRFIVENGNSAEVKKNKDGTLKVYEIKKNARKK